MSWDSKLIDRAKEIIELYPQKRSALGPLLYLAQEKEGYIDDDSVVEISKLIGITEVQVRSVASFYTMYKQEPSGKYLLKFTIAGSSTGIPFAYTHASKPLLNPRASICVAR